MNNPLIKENIDLPDVNRLSIECKYFAKVLEKLGLITTTHEKFSSADGVASDFTEDLGEIVKNAVVNWKDAVNNRNGR